MQYPRCGILSGTNKQYSLRHTKANHWAARFSNGGPAFYSLCLGESMSDFNYKQRPATAEYRENWARIFQPQPAQTVAPGPEAPAPSGSPSPSHCLECGGPIVGAVHLCPAELGASLITLPQLALAFIASPFVALAAWWSR